MPLYSQQIQDKLVKQLIKNYITTLDFSSYQAPAKIVKNFEWAPPPYIKSFLLNMQHQQFNTQEYVALNDSYTQTSEKYEGDVQPLNANENRLNAHISASSSPNDQSPTPKHRIQIFDTTVDKLFDSNTKKYQDFRQNMQELRKGEIGELPLPFLIPYQNINQQDEIRAKLDNINTQDTPSYSAPLLLPFLAGLAIAGILLMLLYFVALAYDRYRRRSFENCGVNIFNLPNYDNNLMQKGGGLDNELQEPNLVPAKEHSL